MVCVMAWLASHDICIWPGRQGMWLGIVCGMALRAWYGICYGLSGKEWCMISPDTHDIIYGMAWRSWHGIFYGLAGIA